MSSSSTTAVQSHSLHETYYGLGDNWWKQIIDGEFHKYGPQVFDKGRHDLHVEPGYLQGVTHASEYAVEALKDAPLSLEIYKTIQTIACRHFRGEATMTSPAHTVGKYRNDTNTRGVIEPHYSHIEKYATELKTRAAAVNAQMDTDFSEIRCYDVLIIYYWSVASDKLKAKAEEYITDFNTKIEGASREETLRHIADLYQKLDWIHPFYDGQGRTDLITLNTLLSKHGFHPAILKHPYFSTYITLDSWVDYLKAGLRSLGSRKSTPNPRWHSKCAH